MNCSQNLQFVYLKANMKTSLVLLISLALVAYVLASEDVNGPVCSLCEDLVNALEDYIAQGHTADEVKAWVDSVRFITVPLHLVDS